MAKRVLLFLVTNLAIMLMLGIILQIVGIFFPGLSMVYRGNPQALVGLFVGCLVWGMGGSFLSLAISRWMAKRSMGVELVEGPTGNADLDWLRETVLRQARQSGLPEPEVGYYHSGEVNAFATGPSKSRSLVAVSTGLLSTMNRREVEAVLAHEVSHIANGDMVTMTLLQGVVNAFVMFFARIVGWGISQALSRSDDDDGVPSRATVWIVTFVLEIVFGILGSIVVATFSRWREFRADAGGAGLAGRDAMIAALEKLKTSHEAIDTSNAAMNTMKISGKSFMLLFSTHPPLDKRIEALRNHA